MRRCLFAAALLSSLCIPAQTTSKREKIDVRDGFETPASGYPSKGYFYLKIGLYRNLMQQSMSVYIDDYAKREINAGEF